VDTFAASHKGGIMARLALLAATLLIAAGAARAAGGPGLSVTIYNADQALVDDVRRLDIAAGRQRLELKDVSAAIRPETVTLTGEGLSIVEQNFDFDLLTPQKMMEKAVGQQVQIVRTNPGSGQETTETATVLSANEGVILKIGDRIEVLRDDGVPTRVIFNGVPQTLRARPTLSVTVDSARAGPRLVDLSYLTTGLSWKADYVALFDETGGKLDLQGWITLTNRSGTPFVDADTQLVAGEVAIAGNPPPFQPVRRPLAGVVRGGAEAGAAPGAAAVGGVHVYTLPERTTIAENQTKQVSFLDAHGVAARRVYRWSQGAFESADNPSSAEVAVAFANSAAGGLGAGLPAGTIRVYERDAAGAPKFVGENPIGHTPRGSELAVKIGEAFDVTVQPTLVSSDVISRRRTRYAMSYRLRNARPAPVTVELRQGGLREQNTVVAESQPGRAIDAYTRGWTVTVPAGGESVLTATLETWW
jgi:hypothetical protein